MSIRTPLFVFDGLRAVRLPELAAFTNDAREVVIFLDGPRQVIAPMWAGWDDFFHSPGVDLGARDQPGLAVRGRV